MSSPLAIAATTAAIKDLLNDGLADHDLGPAAGFTVTSLPPDRIATGNAEPNQLNVFLYQVTANLGWRNEGLPSRSGRGARLSNPPLALDLHYLITAYGADDLNAEILLGYAMHLLHETPVLSRAQLRALLSGTGASGNVPPFDALFAGDLADQIELLKIAPVYLGTEDLSKLWSAMQSRYRPTMAYVVSVVLIQATESEQAVAPVLRRGPDDRGPVALAAPFASLTGARVHASKLLPAMRLGDDLAISGTHLASQGDVRVVFEHAKSRREVVLATTGVPKTSERLVHVPSVVELAEATNLWSSGVYNVSLRVVRPGIPTYVTNQVPIALAPRIAVEPRNAPAGDFTLTIRVAPRLASDQTARTLLVFGDRTVPPASVSTPEASPADLLLPTTLTFDLEAIPAGSYLVRLRVDGIDSLPVSGPDAAGNFAFDAEQRVVVTP